jgi:predicted MFS family arabinose efflux permease
MSEGSGWRSASLVVAAAALAVIPLVLLRLPNGPADRGVAPYGASAGTPVAPSDPMAAPGAGPGPARRAVATLAEAARTRTFWALAAGFAICGASTNGLIATHFIPSAHDHGMPQTTAAGLLAVVGVFDIVGTVASGWLTDKLNPRLLLAAYSSLRGAGR